MTKIRIQFSLWRRKKKRPVKGLTLTIITPKVGGLNYGETIGNVITHKKITTGSGAQLTYASDKALKYEIRHQGAERFGWRLLDKKLQELIKDNLKKSQKGKNKKGIVLNVDNFAKKLIEEYEEFDLFGGLFTKIKNPESGKEVNLSDDYDSVKRTASVNVTYAFSIEPYKGDMDFMNNIDAYNRYIKYFEKKDSQVIVNSETPYAHYRYTITVDLDRIGVWEPLEGEHEKVLEPEKCKKRVVQLLEVIKNLSRRVKGRRESLSPIFVIGGVFSVKNPFFLDAIKARETENGKLYLEVEPILEAIELIPEGERNKVVCGISKGYFANTEEIEKKLQGKEIQVLSVGKAFNEYKKQVEEYYNNITT